ncbi:hypothetical protein BY458DRAFT_544289 [Sporodiniella umbellata]|nr:hypothetical protein BY458DRAFT_544289 [Sporodiniella umbellata]
MYYQIKAVHSENSASYCGMMLRMKYQGVGLFLFLILKVSTGSLTGSLPLSSVRLNASRTVSVFEKCTRFSNLESKNKSSLNKNADDPRNKKKTAVDLVQRTCSRGESHLIRSRAIHQETGDLKVQRYFEGVQLLRIQVTELPRLSYRLWAAA